MQIDDDDEDDGSDGDNEDEVDDCLHMGTVKMVHGEEVICAIRNQGDDL